MKLIITLTIIGLIGFIYYIYKVNEFFTVAKQLVSIYLV